MITFSTPETWLIVNIKDLCLPIDLMSQREKQSGTFRYVDISSVDNEKKEIIQDSEIEFSNAPSRAKQIIKTNDVLVATVRPNLNAVALVPDSLNNEICSTGFCVLRAKEHLVLPEYLFAWVRTEVFVASLEREARGINYPAVNDEDVKKQPIPLPPLSEQKRIVEILREADELQRLRREADDIAEPMFVAIFQDMFGDPQQWTNTTILEKLVKFVGGGTPDRKISHYFTGSIPWATSKDIKTRYLNDSQEHITEEAIQKSATNLVPKRTILMVVKSKILMHALPMGITTQPFCFGQDLKGLVCNEGTIPEFVMASLLIQEQLILNRARGVNTEGLTLESLRQIPIPSIMPKQQLEFFKRIEIQNKIDTDRNSSNDKLKHLNENLLLQGFTGELTKEWRETNFEKLRDEAKERDSKLGRVIYLRAEIKGKTTLIAKATVLRMTAGRGRFGERLSEKQKELLSNVLKEQRYFTSEQIYYEQEGDEKLSRADIKQSLTLFAETGLIRRVRVKAFDDMESRDVFTPVFRLIDDDDNSNLTDKGIIDAELNSLL